MRRVLEGRLSGLQGIPKGQASFSNKVFASYF